MKQKRATSAVTKQWI